MTPAMVRLGVQLARPLLTSADVEAVRELAVDLDTRAWQTLTERWLSLRVGAWVHSHVQTHALSLPDTAAAPLAAQWLNTVQRAVACDQLRDLLAPLLRGHRAPLLQLKGSVVEARAYPAGVLRPHFDLDLLVRPGEQTWQSALRELGLRPTTPRQGHAQSWRLPDAPVTVDLHFALADPRLHPALERGPQREALFARARVGADGLLQLDELDQSAHLLVHLGPGLYGDWRHLADAALWWRAVQPDPLVLTERLASWRAQAVARSAVLALHWFDPALPLGGLQLALGGPGWRARGIGRLAQVWLEDGAYPWPRWLAAVAWAAHWG
jgi:hypothetical protein